MGIILWSCKVSATQRVMSLGMLFIEGPGEQSILLNTGFTLSYVLSFALQIAKGFVVNHKSITDLKASFLSLNWTTTG